MPCLATPPAPAPAPAPAAPGETAASEGDRGQSGTVKFFVPAPIAQVLSEVSKDHTRVADTTLLEQQFLPVSALLLTALRTEYRCSTVIRHFCLCFRWTV